MPWWLHASAWPFPVKPRRACLVGIALLSLSLLIGCARSPRRVVAVPIADLRAMPGTFAQPQTHDALQETQLLYGETVRLIRTEGDWAFVEAVDQLEYTHAFRWQGYPGWMPKAFLQEAGGPRPNAVIGVKWATVWRDAGGTEAWLMLPMGSPVRVETTTGEFWKLSLASETEGWILRGQVELLTELARLPEAQRRDRIVRAAQQLLGDPYFWGGRSPHFGGPALANVTGVDCSGLVNLAYQAAGIRVPRDAHEQFLRARTVAHPQAADLVFLSDPANPHKIVHVLLVAGEESLIEGPGTGLAVRRIDAATRLGRPLAALSSGESVGNQQVFFGTYFR